MAKSVKLKKAERAEAFAKAEERMKAEAVRINENKTRTSTAAPDKWSEMTVRDMVNAEGIQYSNDFRCRQAGDDDLFVKAQSGKYLRIEVKHGAGALAYANVCGLSAFTERTRELCLQKADYVIYYLRPEFGMKRTRIADRYRVCTREDFLDMLEEYCHGPKACGFFTATKFSKHNTQINIQSTYVERFWWGMKNDPRCISLWDFCTDVLGRDPNWD